MAHLQHTPSTLQNNVSIPNVADLRGPKGDYCTMAMVPAIIFAHFATHFFFRCSSQFTDVLDPSLKLSYGEFQYLPESLEVGVVEMSIFLSSDCHPRSVKVPTRN